jgi:hypothetical protein
MHKARLTARLPALKGKQVPNVDLFNTREVMMSPSSGYRLLGLGRQFLTYRLHGIKLPALVRGIDATPDIRPTQHPRVLFLLAFSSYVVEVL